MYPLKQGLKQPVLEPSGALSLVFTHVSIKTRIETNEKVYWLLHRQLSLPMYPLKQGLKPVV